MCKFGTELVTPLKFTFINFYHTQFFLPSMQVSVRIPFGIYQFTSKKCYKVCKTSLPLLQLYWNVRYSPIFWERRILSEQRSRKFLWKAGRNTHAMPGWTIFKIVSHWYRINCILTCTTGWHFVNVIHTKRNLDLSSQLSMKFIKWEKGIGKLALLQNPTQTQKQLLRILKSICYALSSRFTYILKIFRSCFIMVYLRESIIKASGFDVHYELLPILIR